MSAAARAFRRASRCANASPRVCNRRTARRRRRRPAPPSRRRVVSRARYHVGNADGSANGSSRAATMRAKSSRMRRRNDRWRSFGKPERSAVACASRAFVERRAGKRRGRTRAVAECPVAASRQAIGVESMPARQEKCRAADRQRGAMRSLASSSAPQSASAGRLRAASSDRRKLARRRDRYSRRCALRQPRDVGENRSRRRDVAMREIRVDALPARKLAPRRPAAMAARCAPSIRRRSRRRRARRRAASAPAGRARGARAACESRRVANANMPRSRWQQSVDAPAPRTHAG